MRPIHLTTWRRLSSPEAPDEPPSVSEENVLKVECNITVNTNFMLSGIMEVSPLLFLEPDLIVNVGTESTGHQTLPDTWA